MMSENVLSERTSTACAEPRVTVEFPAVTAVLPVNTVKPDTPVEVSKLTSALVSWPVAMLLAGVVQVFEDFRYIDQVETGNTAVLVFEAKVGDKQLNGVDILTFDDEGKIAEMMVMVRPMSGVNALAEAMQRKLSELEAAAAS